MDRRNLLKAGAAVAALPGLARAAPARRAPNFIVILCDDLGYGDIAPYGGAIPTPALARMARALASRLAPGGRIVLSGLLPGQANAAIAAYRAQGLALESRRTLENWVTLTMRRGQVAARRRRS